MKTTRRTFLYGCSATVTALAGTRLSFAGFGAATADARVLVVVFLRGGADGLSMVAPLAGPDRAFYEAARPHLALPVSGAGALLPLDGRFGLSSVAAPLHDLYQRGKVGVVLACGLTHDTRSHFDAQEYMELGTPGTRSTSSGWLGRLLATASDVPTSVLFPALAVGSSQPTSLLGARGTVAMEDPDHFLLNTGPWRWQDAQRAALRRLCNASSSPLHDASSRAMDAVDLVESLSLDSVPPAGGATYPENEIGRSLRLAAGMIRLDVGLRAVTLDVGGWDTHVEQAWSPTDGAFHALLGSLAQGLAAFFADLEGSPTGSWGERVTVVVMSEFGRRLRENADRGTDHGHGSVMLVLGGGVRGGVYGTWPGLAPEQLYDGADLAITTDYRRVLSEIAIRRFANPAISTIFPGYQGYTPLGVVEGRDLPPA